MVAMTYPLIGNYGVNGQDCESRRPFVNGFIVREATRTYSSWRAEEGLGDWLERHRIVGIQEIDTRALTKKLRTAGSLRGVISTVDLSAQSLVAKAKAAPALLGQGLVRKVSTPEPYVWGDEKPLKIATLDFGIKTNILRLLEAGGCQAMVLPADTDAERILSLEPDGVVLPNGPGDPTEAAYAVETVKRLLGRKPIFGICLGHQLLALALGAKTYKLKFGHRGANHPVKDLATGRVEITSQNHGYAVDADSLPERAAATHVNLNDGTNEGIACRDIPAFSVQFHPEALPGPHDSRYLFQRFTKMIKLGLAEEGRA
jgi:carbamoyl-phosphate synthase small subunit